MKLCGSRRGLRMRRPGAPHEQDIGTCCIPNSCVVRNRLSWVQSSIRRRVHVRAPSETRPCEARAANWVVVQAQRSFLWAQLPAAVRGGEARRKARIPEGSHYMNDDPTSNPASLWVVFHSVTGSPYASPVPSPGAVEYRRADETNGNDVEDAAKWRAFRNCARIRVLGSAGFTSVESYRFITLEAWTQHDARSSTDAIAMLEEFVACARQCSAVEPTCLCARRDGQIVETHLACPTHGAAHG